MEILRGRPVILTQVIAIFLKKIREIGTGRRRRHLLWRSRIRGLTNRKMVSAHEMVSDDQLRPRSKKIQD